MRLLQVQPMMFLFGVFVGLVLGVFVMITLMAASESEPDIDDRYQ